MIRWNAGELCLRSRLAIFVIGACYLSLSPHTLLSQTTLTPVAPARIAPLYNAPPGADTSPDLGAGHGIIAAKPAFPSKWTSTQWAIALGKALFWDQQMGSDKTSCASCHFHAGSDTRLRNQLNPGFDDITFGSAGDLTFGSQRSDTGTVAKGKMPSGAVAISDYVLQASDFPMHRIQDETDRNSPVITTTNDRVGTEGTFAATFDLVRIFGRHDKCTGYDGTVFNVPGTNPVLAARQSTPRQAPSVINAVFNHRNFWDGRANNMFNGLGTFGLRDVIANPAARLVVLNNGSPQLTYLTLANASLASQAVTPVLSDVESSCDGRTFADVGKKMTETIPLLGQRVDPGDSVLGPLASPLGGLLIPYTYPYMFRQAFDPKWWSASGTYTISSTGALTKSSGAAAYTQAQLNFSMFEGIAIMMYEATLVSNQTSYDAMLSQGHIGFGQGGNCVADSSVDPLVARGCEIFFSPPPNIAANIPGSKSGGGCAFCHSGALFSEGSYVANQSFQPFVQAFESDGVVGTHDAGHFNVGVQPTFSDQMNGRTDSYNNPLSYVRQYANYLDAVKAGTPNPTSFLLDPDLQQIVAATNANAGGPSPLVSPPPASISATFIPFGTPAHPGDTSVSKSEVDGAAKVPQLRNVGLTPPYFAWGGYATLRQVLRLYNRGVSTRSIGTNSQNPTASNGYFLDAYGSACTSGDDSGSGPDGNQPWPVTAADCGSNLSGLIQPLGLADCNPLVNGVPTPNAACTANGYTPANDDLAALQAFLLTMTDVRVQCDQAPFDHPSLTVVNGESAKKSSGNTGTDFTFTLPAVGAGGYPKKNSYCIPNAGDLFAPGMQARSGGGTSTIQ